MRQSAALGCDARPRRALFIVSRYGHDPRAAGGDVQGTTFARWLAEDGWDVTYLTSTCRGAPASGRDGRVRLLRVPRTALAMVAPLVHRSTGPWDLVYGELLGGAGPVLFLPPLYRPSPIMLAWYQVNAPLLQAQLGRRLGRLAAHLERVVPHLCHGTLVVTPSEARRRDLLALGLPPRRVMAVPPSAVTLCPDAASDEERPPLFVWLGKLRRYKAPQVAVAAMTLLLQRCPDACLVIAGRREDRSLLRELARMAAPLPPGRVRIVTDIDEDTKHRLVHGARALVVTSPVEGFSIAALEAARCGTPVIGTYGVPDDMLTHGRNGLKVPYGDAHALAEAMALLAGSSPLWRELSEGSRERAACYHPEAVRARLREAVARAVSLLGRGRSQGGRD